jgi:uncharacterized protein (DUF433 family)
MEKSYVEQRDGGYWITGTRISLDSLVYAFKRGAAPESIQRAFPLLTLEEIYGAITFSLAQAQDIDTYLARPLLPLEVREVEVEGDSQSSGRMPRARTPMQPLCPNPEGRRDQGPAVARVARAVSPTTG